jgi:hypothetical protein
MSKHSEFIHGTCQQWLFSPKGDIEGALVRAKGVLIQVSVAPGDAATLRAATGPGRRLRILALPDHSPKAAKGAHPVYGFESCADAAGQPVEKPAPDPDQSTIKGVVAAWHYTRHGEPNGVVLETGEFIHLRPRGVVAAGLDIGSKLSATGRVRLTVLGTRLLEAHRVNRIDLP